MTAPEYPWERPLGAHPRPDGATEFRVWAPRAGTLAVRVGGGEHALRGRGVRRLRGRDRGRARRRLRVRARRRGAARSEQPLAAGRAARPVAGRSTRRAFEWTDEGWRRRALPELVIYELHVGTFTPEGTFDAAIAHLAGLARARGHRDRGDAGRRVPGPPRLGLRRRLPLGRALRLRRAAGLRAARRRRPRGRPGGDPRRRLQPRRRVRRRRRSRPSGPTSPRSTRRSGARR